MIGDRWGVTDDDVSRPYPCDELVVSPTLRAWRGVRVEAPAAAVWPWVAQVRLAPYSYDWVDNRGRRSPRRLMDLPEPRVGDAFTASGGRPMGRIVSVDPGKQLTGAIMGGFMSYVLVPERPDPAAAGGGDHSRPDATRLLLKVVMRAPRWTVPGLAVGDLVMARRQLLTFKRLAEGDA
ncbi:polyketide cyclase [Actinoplanes sp. NPDC049548]|uniref:polyketide cyclase n=1 Tax=Actinoplanes sp. NPDC049548 TaxID=3155152 RepID=UPI003437D968